MFDGETETNMHVRQRNMLYYTYITYINMLHILHICYNWRIQKYEVPF